MSSNYMLRKSLAYAPRARETTLSAHREIANAVAPHIVGEEFEWKRLSFLLNADTAYLTQSLSLSWTLEREQISALADFIIKRGERPFNKIIADGFIFNEISNELRKKRHSGYINAYAYDISCNDDPDLTFSFPDFAIEIKMYKGVIVAEREDDPKLPTQLVELDLFDTEISEELLASLESANHLTHLSLSGREVSYVLHGLPQYLEQYICRGHVFYAQCGIEGSNEGLNCAEDHHYDCPQLRILECTNVDLLPKAFIESIEDSLIEIDIRGYGAGIDPELSQLMRKMRKLEKFTYELSHAEFDIWTLPPSVKVIKYTGERKEYDGSRPLTNIRELDIQADFDIATILKNAPNIEVLGLAYTAYVRLSGTRYTEKIRLTGVYPSIKKFNEAGHHNRNGLDLSGAKEHFPNLIEYSNSDFTANFNTKEVVVKYSLILPEAIDLPDFGQPIGGGRQTLTKYTFKFDAIHKSVDRVILISLPANTERITIETQDVAWTHIYDINQLLNSTPAERERFYERLELKVDVVKHKFSAFIRPVPKSVQLALATWSEVDLRRASAM